MRPFQLTTLKGATGRADLLRVLAVTPRNVLILDNDGEDWFGYVKSSDQVEVVGEGKSFISSKPVESRDNVTNNKLPLRMPFVHLITERLPRQIEQPVVAEPLAEPIDEDSAKPPLPYCLVSYEDLMPYPRLIPALRRQLSTNRLGKLDLNRLVQNMAEQEMPRYLPRRRLQNWHPELVVILDFCWRLWPYREDMHRLATRLLQYCGRSGVSLRIINHGPLGTWSDWLAHQNPYFVEQPLDRHWQMPVAGTPVLIVSDLGLLEGGQSAQSRVWQAFISTLIKAQAKPVALLPLGAEQLDGAISQLLTMLRWSPDARARPESAHGSGKPMPAGLDDLLAMAAVARRVDPPLLRAMRKINPRASLNAGLEGALWRHNDVEAGAVASLKPATLAKHLGHFMASLQDYHLTLEAIRHTHHAHLRAVLNHEETLLWQAHAAVENANLPMQTRQRIANAENFMRKLEATLKQPDSLRSAGIWWNVAQDIVQRADSVMGEKYGKLLNPLVAALSRVTGNLNQLPNWTDPMTLSGLIDDGNTPLNSWLVRDAARGCISLQSRPPEAGQTLLSEPLLLDAGGFRIEKDGQSHWYPASVNFKVLCSLAENTVIKLITSRESITIAAVKRPHGALSWGCNAKGVWVQSPSLCGLDHRWDADELTHTNTAEGVLIETAFTKLNGHLGMHEAKLPCFEEIWNEAKSVFASVCFSLDHHGVLATLQISSPLLVVMQGLRWIEPGSFWMGSPEDESERANEEGPQHTVTLSQGFWLADTACTQGLWEAVMGSNPSKFKGDDQLPVESVSWFDVQEFLGNLEALFPGCRAGLPTEAEWEYACRAGTQTPFSFGEGISPDEVNYDGGFPYAGGEKGLYRERTVPVKNLPSNGWGLYQMHGNVWEWCEDELRSYDGEPQRDPVGQGGKSEEAPRAVRGGSWSIIARGARSAYRLALRPGDADLFLGFRLCLRSIEPSVEKDRPGGTEG